MKKRGLVAIDTCLCKKDVPECSVCILGLDKKRQPAKGK